MPHTLPKLSYPYDALEPYIDAKTMEIHHSQHHQTYVDKLNTALEKYPQLQAKPVAELLRDLNSLPVDDTDRTAIRNHGGGVYNHNLFWEVMGPNKEIDQALVEKLNERFGSIVEFKKLFSAAAAGQFGSGWAWLVSDQAGVLQVYNLPNQDCPLTLGHTPIIGLDVWEHAYYLKYQNRRAEYIEEWWNVLKIL